MVVTLWWKRYTPTLLEGLQIGAAITENSMEIPQKTCNGTTIWPSYTTPPFRPKRLKISIA